MKAYITKLELYYDDDDVPLANIDMYDAESYTVKIDNIVSPSYLRGIADVLEKLIKTKGVFGGEK